MELERRPSFFHFLLLGFALLIALSFEFVNGFHDTANLQVGTSAGFAMVFALLAAATLWNVGTWYFPLPSSSTHTMVGSIIGVGITNQLMAVKEGTSGVDWSQAAEVGKSLFVSPLLGFFCAGLLLVIAKMVIKDRRLSEAPQGDDPPPF